MVVGEGAQAGVEVVGVEDGERADFSGQLESRKQGETKKAPHD